MPVLFGRVPPPMMPGPAGARDQIRDCLGIDRDKLRILVRDLYERKAAVYWSDLAGSVAIGYGSFAAFPVRMPFSLMGAALFAVCVLALYRAVLFIHELSHMRSDRFRVFRLAWSVLCGTPMLVPAYFYDEHRAHHARRTYGTHLDGEYLAFARLPLWYSALLIAASPFVPPFLFLRFLIGTPLLLIAPGLRPFIIGRASALVIDPGYRRPVPPGGIPRRWLRQELACFGWCMTVVAGVAAGMIDLARVAEAAAVMTGILTVNAVRTLLAHRYEGERVSAALCAQVLDSNDFSSPLGILWAPVGLRFHAIHHLLPSLPYHALETAHRRILATIPAESPFWRCQHRSFLSGVRSAIAARRQGARNS